MAANVKKAAPRANKAGAGKTSGKATQARTGAGPAIAERSKDAKPSFGKAAPKKVVPAAESKAAKPAASKSAVRKTATPAKGKDGSIVAKVARAARTTASVAVGAVVATAKLATPSRKGKDDKAK